MAATVIQMVNYMLMMTMDATRFFTSAIMVSEIIRAIIIDVRMVKQRQRSRFNGCYFLG